MSDGASNASGACDAPQSSPSRRASQTLLVVHINTQTLRQHKAQSGQVRQPLPYVLALPVPRMDTCSSSARDASENGATVAMVFLPRNYYKGTMIPSTFRAKPSHRSLEIGTGSSSETVTKWLDTSGRMYGRRDYDDSMCSVGQKIN